MDSSRKKTKSLYRELTTALVVLVSLVSVMASLLYYNYSSREVKTLYQNKQSDYANHLRRSLEWPLWNIDDELIGNIGRAFSANDEIASLSVRDDQKRVIFHQQKPNVQQRKQVIPIEHNGKNIGTVELGLTLLGYEEKNQQLLLMSIATTIMLVISLLGAMRWIVAKLLREPVATLTEAIREVVDGKYRPIELTKTYVEFAPIISGFKSMTDAVASRESSLRQINEHLAAEIDERKRVGEALRANEERLNLATNAGGIGIWDWDVSNNVLTWDESMYSLFGVRREDFSGDFDAWSRTLHPDDRQFTEGEIQAALRGEREYAGEFRVISSDGAVRYIKASSKTYHDPQGNPVRMIGSNVDITAIKQAEGELKLHKDHLEEEVKQRTAELQLARVAAEMANQAKSMFLANMSHEIRTPMNAVLGFSQLLEHDRSLSSEARSKISTIMKSGDHLLSIINDILEMSRIEAGRIEVRTEPVHIVGLLNDLGAMFRLRAEQKGVTFTLETSAVMPLYIMADMGKIRQIMINLLGNAIKFTRQGSISLRSFPAINNRIIIEVQDTGIGISPEELLKLFQPFERTRSGEQEAGGTGLGLAISRQYARLLGGEITVATAAGEGSCFRFEFPAPVSCEAPDAVETPRRVIGLAPGQGDMRVLVVDDVRNNRELLRQMLEPLGFSVDEAMDGAEALDRVDALHPRIILMDMLMPGMDGSEATRILRRRFDKDALAIFGISASVFEAEKQQFLDSGVNGFIAKPFREQELYDLLAKHAGVHFETETLEVASLQIEPDRIIPTLEKMTPEWCDAFREMLAIKNITRIRRLGEGAQAIDPQLSAWVLERLSRHDLEGLKRLITIDGSGAGHDLC
jgi:PAS domain S-box-containing protein